MKTSVVDGGGSLGRSTWWKIWLEEKMEGARALSVQLRGFWEAEVSIW